MGQGTSLSARSLTQSLYDHFRIFPEHRDPLRVEIPMEDALMSGYAVFSLKFPSLLQFEEWLKEQTEKSNLRNLYQVTRVPSDTQMRAILDEVNPYHFRKVFTSVFERAQRGKCLEKFLFFEGKYLLSVDGTGYFLSEEVRCESCIEKYFEKTKKTTYSHQMLCGSIVHPENKTVIPLCPEPICKQDKKTNDGEKAAMKRFIEKFRQDHPRLPVILIADALHSDSKFIKSLKYFDMDFILSVKPGNNESLFGYVSQWEGLNRLQSYTYEEEIGIKIKKKRIHEFRFANNILLNKQDVNLAINFIDYWETTQWVDQWGELQETKIHFSWITNLPVNNDNIMQLMRGGRCRWKIENETFNTLKNQGYEFEHNFGHGYKNLSTNFAFLMMLAFTVDQLQESSCKLFQKALKKKLSKRTRLFETIKGLYNLTPTIESWEDLWSMIIEPKSWKMVKDTS
jgi:hypothetical protein